MTQAPDGHGPLPPAVRNDGDGRSILAGFEIALTHNDGQEHSITIDDLYEAFKDKLREDEICLTSRY